MVGVFEAVRHPAKTSLLCLLLVACDRGEPAPPGPASVASAPVSASAAAPATPAPAPAPAPDPLPPIAIDEFTRLFRELSEPDRYFFSDNFVSNETSVLQVAPLLARRAHKGGAYIGVGPEQNFSYIALTEPKLAFIVDIRRQNALQHLLFKALFTEAESRAHFLALLLGRPWKKSDEPAKGASIEALLSSVERVKPDRPVFDEAHARVRRRIAEDWKLSLTKTDLETLERTYRAFFEDQLELRFELHEQNGRKYPALRELLAASDPDGTARGFLATDEAFASVKRLHDKNRIIPVVGDFAGEHALKAVAAELRKRDLPVGAFYVSNVEQYVMEPEKWKAYVSNVTALPSNEKSLFIRCYLDQGRRHPMQMKGHRTVTVLQPFDHFRWRQEKRGYGSFWALATDGNLSE